MGQWRSSWRHSLAATVLAAMRASPDADGQLAAADEPKVPAPRPPVGAETINPFVYVEDDDSPVEASLTPVEMPGGMGGMGMMMGGMGGIGGDTAAAQDLTPEERQRRLKYLATAVQNLRQAGLDDQADLTQWMGEAALQDSPQPGVVQWEIDADGLGMGGFSAGGIGTGGFGTGGMGTGGMGTGGMGTGGMGMGGMGTGGMGMGGMGTGGMGMGGMGGGGRGVGGGMGPVRAGATNATAPATRAAPPSSATVRQMQREIRTLQTQIAALREQLDLRDRPAQPRNDAIESDQPASR